MSKLYTYEDKDGNTRIASIKLDNVKLSYAYLMSPRPAGSFGEGEYGAELMIYDTETVELIQAYIQTVIEEGRHGVWSKKMPKNINKPFRRPDPENNQYEQDAILIVKTKSRTQPDLFIRDEGSARARAVTEEDFENSEIMSGNIAEAVVSFRAWEYSGKGGITAYINAVCKTGEGTPVSGRPKINLADEFSLAGDFDVEEDAEAPQTKPAAKADVLKELTNVAPDPEVQASTDILADLVKKPAAVQPTVNKPAMAEQAAQPAKRTTIDDLLG